MRRNDVNMLQSVRVAPVSALGSLSGESGCILFFLLLIDLARSVVCESEVAARGVSGCTVKKINN